MSHLVGSFIFVFTHMTVPLLTVLFMSSQAFVAATFYDQSESDNLSGRIMGWFGCSLVALGLGIAIGKLS